MLLFVRAVLVPVHGGVNASLAPHRHGAHGTAERRCVRQAGRAPPPDLLPHGCAGLPELRVSHARLRVADAWRVLATSRVFIHV